jgi:AAHS family 3-hydroxyphenylpropionic acid transporter
VIFYVGGLAPLLVVPLLMLFLPESSQFRAAVRGEGAPRLGIVSALAGEGRWRWTLLLWGAFFAALLVLYLLLNWLPSLMVAQGFSASQAATLQVVFNVAGAAGALAGGAALDRIRPWTVAAVIFVGAGVALLALAAAPASFESTMAVIALVGVTIMAAQAILYAAAPSVYPVQVRGAGVGAAVAVGRAGSVAGPLIAGALLGAGRDASDVLYLILPCLAVGGVLAVCLFAFRRPRA